jgi:hypothetical protein
MLIWRVQTIIVEKKIAIKNQLVEEEGRGSTKAILCHELYDKVEEKINYCLAPYAWP